MKEGIRMDLLLNDNGQVLHKAFCRRHENYKVEVRLLTLEVSLDSHNEWLGASFDITFQTTTAHVFYNSEYKDCI